VSAPSARRTRLPVWTPRIGAALAVAALVASIPLEPLVFLVPAVLLGLALLARGDVARAEITAVLSLAALGCLAQIASSFVLPPTPTPPDAAAPQQGVDALGRPLDGAPNLIANGDLSWLQGWSRAGGASAHALAVGDGFWRVKAVDAASLTHHTEIRTLSQTRVEAGRPYRLSVLLRHDGTRFDGELAFRTPAGIAYPGTTLERVGNGLLRASAVLDPLEAPAHLRLLHLVRLDGDWTHLDVGFAQLTVGDEVRAYRPHAPRSPWHAGVVWWLALALALVATAPAMRAAFRRVGGGPVATGLLLGLALQAAIVAVAALGGATIRTTGTFFDPNLLAHVVVVSALAVGAVSPRPLRDVSLALALAAVSVWFSGSRSGMLGLVIGAAAMAAVLPVAPRRRAALALGAAAVIGVGAMVAVSSGSRIADALGGDQNVRARWQVLETSLALAATYPLTGVGHQNLGNHYEFAVPPEPGPRYRNAHAHSLVHVPVSFGWPVAIAMLAALLALLRRLAARRGGPAIVVLLVALALNLGDLTLFHSAVFLPVWLAHAALTPHPAASGRG
jgi:hypothetical protein